MALTLRSAAIGANSSPSDSLSDVADAIALQSLRGAQGNSGVILSQYFRGVAESIHGRKRLYLGDMGGTFRAGAESAYRSVREPREGTILTVLNEIAVHAEKPQSRRGLGQMLESAINRGRHALEATRCKIKELSDANVVDAGGQGFLHFMEGIVHLIRRGDIVSGAGEAPIGELAIPTAVDVNSRFRFCSEFLVKAPKFDLESARNKLSEFGDSLIVASASFGPDSYLRIHIHTDSPTRVEKLAASLGVLEKRKIDDMQAQNKSMRRWRSFLRRGPARTVRIVTDSTCDLPLPLATFYGIEVVPLKVSFGDQVFLDGVDLDNLSFYRKLRDSQLSPTTSQPSPADFMARYREQFDRTDCDRILSIHLSSKLSGTLSSAVTAAREFGGKVTALDSGTVSLGMGLMAISAAEMAGDGAGIDSIISRLEELKKEQGLFFTLGTLDYLIRGGRIGRARGMMGKLLGLRPILALRDGEVVPIAKVRGERVMEKILALLPEEGNDYRWAVGHADSPAQVELLTEVLKERFGAGEVLAGEIGPAVGAHAGPGSWGIFYMKGRQNG
jgi:hypothetical protein